VRGLQNAVGNPVDALYRIMDNRVEVVEFAANQNTKILDTPLKKLNIIEGVLVAAIVRHNEIIIPHGNDVIKERDNIILIAKDKKLADLNDIVEPGE
jgi:trk system potassium uptake protein TrkA